MATINVMRRHELGLAGGRQAVQAVADRLQQDLNARHSWYGDTLKFDCPGADGQIEVTTTQVTVVVNLSWMLGPARGKIERSINEYLDSYLVG